MFINGRPRLLRPDELVHARVQYFLNGESVGLATFNSRRHVKAAVDTVALPRGATRSMCSGWLPMKAGPSSYSLPRSGLTGKGNHTYYQSSSPIVLDFLHFRTPPMQSTAVTSTVTVVPQGTGAVVK